MATPIATAAAIVQRAQVSINIPTITPVSISINIPSITPFTFTPVHRTDCVTATPDADGHVPPTACNALWQYYPSIAAAVAFAVIFGILLIAHSTQAAMLRKKFCWVLIVAGAWELGSFVTRAIAVHNQQSGGLATVSQLLVLLAPLWINAFVYMVLARLIYFLMPDHKLCGVRASFVAFIFVWLDVISFFIQLIGGFIASPGAPSDQVTNGLHVYMGGVGIQEFWILAVVALTAALWVEVRRLEAHGALPRGENQRGWRVQLSVVLAVLVLISARIVFRLVEFSSGVGQQNPIPTTEWYFYVFDAAPMAVAIALLSVFHPGRFLQGPFSEFPKLSKPQKKEVKLRRKAAKAAAKACGDGWLARVKVGQEVKKQLVEEFAAANWGVRKDAKIVDEYEL